jgi:hypothetical protein
VEKVPWFILKQSPYNAMSYLCSAKRQPEAAIETVTSNGNQIRHNADDGKRMNCAGE